MAYMRVQNAQLGDLGGLKKLLRKSGNVLKKVAPIALPVVGGVAGVLAGSALSKLVSGGSSKGMQQIVDPNTGNVYNVNDNLTENNKHVPYATMNSAQLQTEVARLQAMLASPSTSANDRNNATAKLANAQAALASLAVQAAPAAAAISPFAATVATPAVNAGTSGGAATVAATAAQTGLSPDAVVAAINQAAAQAGQAAQLAQTTSAFNASQGIPSTALPAPAPSTPPATDAGMFGGMSGKTLAIVGAIGIGLAVLLPKSRGGSRRRG